MPRSDPHFKFHETFSRHPNTIRVWSNNDMLACYVRVGVALIRHFADRTDDQMVVGGEELKEIAGTEQVGGAVQRLRKLSRCSPVEFLDPYDDEDAVKVRSGCRQAVRKVSASISKVWVLGLPNFAKKQGFGPRNSKQRAASATATVREEEIPTESLVGVDSPTGDGETPTKSRGSRQSDEVKSTGPETRAASVALQWSACVSAAATYGKRWSPKPSARRVTMLAARLRDFPSANSDVLVRAVHGAVRSWNRDEESIAKWLRPETVYRRSNFEKYIEAYNEPDIPVTQKGDQNARRDNTVRGALGRLAEKYAVGPDGDRSEIVDVRSTVQRVPDE